MRAAPEKEGLPCQHWKHPRLVRTQLPQDPQVPPAQSDTTPGVKDLPSAPYWVVDLGPVENNMYQYSIVSDDKKLSLFVLARNVSEFYEKYDTTVLNKLDTLGFNTFINKPIPTNQDNCSYP